MNSGEYEVDLVRHIHTHKEGRSLLSFAKLLGYEHASDASRVFDGTRGVRLSKLTAFLDAFKLKVVHAEMMAVPDHLAVVDPLVLEAMRVLSEAFIQLAPAQPAISPKVSNALSILAHDKLVHAAENGELSSEFKEAVFRLSQSRLDDSFTPVGVPAHIAEHNKRLRCSLG